MKLSRAFNGFDETYAINSTGEDQGPVSYLLSKKDAVAHLLRAKIAELKNVKVRAFDPLGFSGSRFNYTSRAPNNTSP